MRRKFNILFSLNFDGAPTYKSSVVRSIDASAIAEELMQLFARVGVLKEILTDQGSNFTVAHGALPAPARQTHLYQSFSSTDRRFGRALQPDSVSNAEEDGC